jgi:CHAT domain-containing protein/tetratricopeptide (TPR) repeat protein
MTRNRRTWKIVKALDEAGTWDGMGAILRDCPAELLQPVEDLFVTALRQCRAAEGDSSPSTFSLERMAWIVHAFRLRGSRTTPLLAIDPHAPPHALPASLSDLGETIALVVNTPDVRLFRQMIAGRPELLGPHVTDALAHLADALRVYREFGEEHLVRRRRGLLLELRETGRFDEAEFAPRESRQRDLLQLITRFESLTANWEATGDDTVLDAALEIVPPAMNHPAWFDLADASRLTALYAFANAHTARNERRGGLADAEMAVRLNRDLVDQTPLDYQHRAGFEANLGNSLRTLFGALGNLDDLEEAVAALRNAATAIRPESPHRFLIHNNLGNVLMIQYEVHRDPAVLAETMAAFTLATRPEAGSDENLPTYVYNFSRALLQRHVAEHREEDLRRALELAERSAEMGAALPQRHMYLGHLAEVLYETSRAFGRDEDLIDRALGCVDDALAITPPQHPGRVSYLATRRRLNAEIQARAVLDPGGTLDVQARLQDSMRVATDPDADAAARRDALDQVISIVDLAAAGTPDPEQEVLYLDLLARGLHQRYSDHGTPDDLEREIETLEWLTRTAPTADRLGRLSAGLREHHLLSDATDDLERSVTAMRAALDVCPPDDPDRWAYRGELGHALYSLYRVRGTDDPTLLDEALAAAEEAQRAIPDPGVAVDLALWRYERSALDPADGGDLTELLAVAAGRPEAKTRLGMRLQNLYLRSGRTAELDGAILLLRSALARTADDKATDVTATALCAALRLRSGSGDRAANLRESEGILRERLAATTAPQMTLQFELAGTLYELYQATGDGGNLDECVHLDEQVLQHSGAADVIYMGALASALIARHELAQSRTDLVRAVALLSQATAREGPPAPERAVHLNSHASALRLLSQLDGRPELLDAAITLARRAVSILPLDAPYRATYVTNLAVLVIERAGRDDDLVELDSALATVRESVGAASSDHIRSRLLLALGQLLVHRHEVGGEAADLQAAAEALWESVAVADATTRMKANRSLGELLAELDRWPEAAEAFVQCVESLGGIFAAQQTRLYQEAWLRESADLPVSAAYALARAGDLDRAVRTLESGRTRLLNEALGSETGTPGSTTPPDEPLVYLLSTPWGGLAIVTARSGGRSALWLPELTGENLHDQVYGHTGYIAAMISGDRARWYAVLEDTTAWLWQAAMGPVLEAVSAPPAMTVVPAGPLALLPLHAAWRPDASPDGRRYVLDTTAVRYAPNAGILARSRPGARLVPDGILTIADPQPVTADPLPYARLESEGIAALFPRVLALSGQEAAHEAVAARLGEFPVVHFACHATTDIRFTLDNGPVLAGDVVLSLRQLLQTSLRARLAVASACQTAIADASMPDEVVSLSTGLLQAGAAGVMATSWQVPDASTMILMLSTFRWWLVNSKSPAEALRAAQRWLREATNAEILAELAPMDGGDWPPTSVRVALRRLLAFGEPGAKPFAHPFHWAGFSYHGT